MWEDREIRHFGAFSNEVCGDLGVQFDTIHVTFSVNRGNAGLDGFFVDSIILQVYKIRANPPIYWEPPQKKNILCRRPRLSHIINH